MLYKVHFPALCLLNIKLFFPLICVSNIHIFSNLWLPSLLKQVFSCVFFLISLKKLLLCKICLYKVFSSNLSIFSESVLEPFSLNFSFLFLLLFKFQLPALSKCQIYFLFLLSCVPPPPSSLLKVCAPETDLRCPSLSLSDCFRPGR